MIEILKYSQLENTNVDPVMIDHVLNLLTPEDILQKQEFDRPEPIFLPRYPSFDDLKLHQERIRLLKLLPIKSDEDHDRYNQLPKDQLVTTVEKYLEDSNITLARNLYPYWLPADLAQYLIWIKKPETDRLEISKFICKSMTFLDLNPEDVILYERPRATKSLLVKGTFPAYRHLHFWIKISDLNQN